MSPPKRCYCNPMGEAPGPWGLDSVAEMHLKTSVPRHQARGMDSSGIPQCVLLLFLLVSAPSFNHFPRERHLPVKCHCVRPEMQRFLTFESHSRVGKIKPGPSSSFPPLLKPFFPFASSSAQTSTSPCRGRAHRVLPEDMGHKDLPHEMG